MVLKGLRFILLKPAWTLISVISHNNCKNIRYWYQLKFSHRCIPGQKVLIFSLNVCIIYEKHERFLKLDICFCFEVNKRPMCLYYLPVIMSENKTCLSVLLIKPKLKFRNLRPVGDKNIWIISWILSSQVLNECFSSLNVISSSSNPKQSAGLIHIQKHCSRVFKY